jgi:PAS domain S-box-containing protein
MTTERKPAERALPESGERFHRYFDLGLIGMAITSPTKGCLEVNDEICRILGYDREELLAKTWTEMTHPGDLAVDVAQFNRVMAGEIDGYTMDKRWVRKDGRVILTTISVKCVRRDDRSVDYFVALLQDVTDARQSELAAFHLAAIVESSEDAIISNDLDGIIQSWNHGAEQILGYSATEAVGGHIGLIIPEEWRAEEDAVFIRIRRGEAVDHFETVRRAKDGRRVDVSLAVSPIRDASGAVIGASNIARDISERKRFEAQQAALLVREQKALAAAKAANQARDEFLAILSHELRNPLAAIMTGSHLLHRVAAESSTGHETRALIERQVEQLARLVDDLLDVSRITAGRIVLRRELVDLRAIVHHAIETTRPLVGARQHRVEIALPNTPLPVDGDVVRLGQVLSNLLNNAATYTDPGGQIWVTAVATESQAVVRVVDNGVGIATADLRHIFDLFSRGAHGLDHTAGGLGIGLMLARRLVELHGGSLDAASDGPGRGSEFVVRLPLAAPLPERPDRSAVTRPVSVPARPRRILVVDDNESFAIAMTALLRAMGHDVRTAPMARPPSPRRKRSGRTSCCSTSACQAAAGTTSRASCVGIRRSRPCASSPSRATAKRQTSARRWRRASTST